MRCLVDRFIGSLGIEYRLIRVARSILSAHAEIGIGSFAAQIGSRAVTMRYAPPSGGVRAQARTHGKT